MRQFLAGTPITRRWDVTPSLRLLPLLQSWGEESKEAARGGKRVAAANHSHVAPTCRGDSEASFGSAIRGLETEPRFSPFLPVQLWVRCLTAGGCCGGVVTIRPGFHQFRTRSLSTCHVQALG